MAESEQSADAGRMSYWESHVVASAKSSDTVLHLEPTAPAERGDIIGLQSGEEALILAEPRLSDQGLAVQVTRGYRRSVVRPVALLDAVWFVEKARDIRAE